jgi:hypothetical protein
MHLRAETSDLVAAGALTVMFANEVLFDFPVAQWHERAPDFAGDISDVFCGMYHQSPGNPDPASFATVYVARSTPGG